MGFIHNLLVAIMFFFFVLFIIVVFIIGMQVDENCCISESDQICRLYYDLLHLSNIDDTKILIQKDFQFWVWELLICYPCILYKMQWNYP